MKSITNLLIIFSMVLFSCAVQSVPTGGPPDKAGPYIKEASPGNGTLNISKFQNIEINFNEMLDPKKIKSSINIYPQVDFSIVSITNKIVIKPKKMWPDGIIKINISREITDYHGNLMNHSYILNYSTNSFIPTGKISGKIFNTGMNNISEIGLYKIKNNNIDLVCITQSDYENKFLFNNIINGEYIVIALQGKIENIKDDIRKNNYSLYSETISIKDNIKYNINLNFNVPAYKRKIKSFTKENQYFGFLQMDDGSSIYVLDSILDKNNYINDKSFLFYDNIDDIDSINIKISLNNNIEYYSIEKMISMKENINDMKKPFIESTQFINNKFTLFFSEPISIKHKNNVFQKMAEDSNMVNIDFAIESPTILSLNDDFSNLSSNIIKINNSSIVDVSSNSNFLLDSSLVINKNNYNFSKNNNLSEGGNIFGKIIYNGSNQVIVEAIDITSGYKKNIIAEENGDYKLFDLQPGIYQLWAYENLNKVNSSYFNGSIVPLRLSAKFSYYDELIETRAKWDIEKIDIIIN